MPSLVVEELKRKTMKTTWRKLIDKAFEDHQDNWENVEGCTLTEQELDKRFDDGFGGIDGEPFTLWTKDFVYFPVVYDGSEWVGYAPRNPNKMKTPHQGGW
jgi:hypothetical protein